MENRSILDTLVRFRNAGPLGGRPNRRVLLVQTQHDRLPVSRASSTKEPLIFAYMYIHIYTHIYIICVYIIRIYIHAHVRTYRYVHGFYTHTCICIYLNVVPMAWLGISALVLGCCQELEAELQRKQAATVLYASCCFPSVITKQPSSFL